MLVPSERPLASRRSVNLRRGEFDERIVDNSATGSPLADHRLATRGGLAQPCGGDWSGKRTASGTVFEFGEHDAGIERGIVGFDDLERGSTTRQPAVDYELPSGRNWCFRRSRFVCNCGRQKRRVFRYACNVHCVWTKHHDDCEWAGSSRDIHNFGKQY